MCLKTLTYKIVKHITRCLKVCSLTPEQRIRLTVVESRLKSALLLQSRESGPLLWNHAFSPSQATSELESDEMPALPYLKPQITTHSEYSWNHTITIFFTKHWVTITVFFLRVSTTQHSRGRCNGRVLSHPPWPTPCDPWLQPARLLCPRASPAQETGVGCLALLQGISSTQGLNPGLLHCRWILYQLRHQEVHKGNR